MPLVFVTGMSGAGKSSVCGELRRRGLDAHDTDEDGISLWRHRTTDEVVERPDRAEDRTDGWYAAHDWIMSRRRVEELAARAGGGPVFLCGSPTNADDLADLYDTVVCLTVDEDTMRARIAGRSSDEFGGNEVELRMLLGWHARFEARYRNSGAVMVDATRPLRDVVEDVVDAARRPG
jgi:thymidylate kinase